MLLSPPPQKADKSALESKVSRLQFDSATEQLNAMFHELLNKVTGQEQDWHKVIDKLSTEMECKVGNGSSLLELFSQRLATPAQLLETSCLHVGDLRQLQEENRMFPSLA